MQNNKQIRSPTVNTAETCCLSYDGKDTVLGHLCHEIIVVKEEEADHSDDE